MATYHAVAATSLALVALLRQASATEFPGAQFAVFQASDFSKKALKEGVSLHLYRVATNTSRRNLPPRLASDGHRYRPSLPVDLFYLLTAWAADAAKQQLLLGWCMRVFEDSPILPAEFINDTGTGVPAFRPTETLEIVTDPISIQDMTSLWEALKTPTQLSMTYVARMVALDSRVEIAEGAAVQTHAFDTGALIDR